MQGGGSLSLPAITAFNSGVYSTATFQATGAGSLLDLAALAAINGAGAAVSADGTGAIVDLSALTAIAGGSFSATAGGTIKLPAGLTSLDKLSVTVDGTGTFPIGQFTSLTHGRITVEGGTYSLPNLTGIDGSSLLVENGGSLTLPGVTSYGSAGYGGTFQVNGTGSLLSLPALALITGGGLNLYASGAGSKIMLPALGAFDGGFNSAFSATLGGSIVLDPSLTTLKQVNLTLDSASGLPLDQFTSFTNGSISVQAGAFILSNLSDIDGTTLYVSNGGSLTLPAVSTYADPGYSASFQASGANSLLSLPALTKVTGNDLSVYSNGAGAVVDLSALTTFTPSSGNLSATGSGAIRLNAGLTHLDGITVTLDGTGTISLDQVTSLAGGSIQVQGGTYTLPNLTDIDGAYLNVQGGGSLTLPAAISDNNTRYYSSFQAYGTGSVLSLPALASLTGNPMQFSANGAGSLVDLSGLVSIAIATNFSATNQGEIRLPSGPLTLSSTTIALDGTGIFPLDRFTSLTHDQLSLQGGTYDLPNLTNIDGTAINAGGGAVVTLPSVTSYANPNNYAQTYLQANGAGTVLSLPALSGLGVVQSTLYLEAFQGGHALFPALAAVNSTAQAVQYVQVVADGAGSLVDLSGLKNFSSPYGSLSATNGGTILDTSIKGLDGVTLTIDATGTLGIGALSFLTNSVLNVQGGTFTLNSLTDIDGTSLYVRLSGSLILPGITSFANATPYRTAVFQATGGGSLLSLPNLATLGANVDYLQVQALQGGTTRLPALAAITLVSPYVQLEADGAASTLDLSTLASFEGASGQASLRVTGGGTLIDPLLKHFVDINLTADSTATLTLASDETYTTTPGANTTVYAGTLEERGVLAIPDNTSINVRGSLAVDGLGILALTPAAILYLSGNLSGDTTDGDKYAPLGTVQFDRGAGVGSPQTLEAMSADLGASQLGFRKNFAYGTISLTGNTYLQLVDQARNSTGTGAEAVYADELVVPAGATVDLNGLHLYVRGMQVGGTILNGTVTQVPGGGPIQQGVPTAGDLAQAGAVDNWSFFGRSGETVSVALNTGNGGTPSALAPRSATGPSNCWTPPATSSRPATAATARSSPSPASPSPSMGSTRSASGRRRASRPPPAITSSPTTTSPRA